MSAANRHDGHELRVRYARAFDVPVDSVELVELEPDGPFDERCAVQTPGLPVWTTDGPAPEWMRKRVKTGGAS